MDSNKKIAKARVQLLLKQPFFGTLALGLDIRRKDNMPMPTMATDGYYLYYDDKFVKQAPDNELQTIISHEVLHCALQHTSRRQTREHFKWNLSCDAAVNYILKQEGFTMPKGCILLGREFDGLSAEAIYAKLPDPPAVQGYLMDSHDEWENGNGKKGEDGEKSGDGEKSNVKVTLPQVWRERVTQAATIARMQGKLPSSVEELIQDILNPRLDWRTILRNMIQSTAKNDYRLCPPSKKHIWSGIYLPSVKGEELKLAIGIDTSGSISESEFQEFLAEVRGITEQFANYELHLYFCDAAVHSKMVLMPHDAWPDSFPKASGGTDFRGVFNAIEEESLDISALVYLTDGYGTYPESPPNYPVIWVMNADCQPPWGETIRIDLNGR